MKQKLIPTWVVVTDSAKARFFAVREGDDGRMLVPVAPTLTSNLTAHARDARSDKPGRSFASTGSGVRHAIEPHHDYHKLEKHDFTHEVMQFLEKSFDEHLFERLVLVAPHRSLGELRTLLPHKMQASLWHEIGRDFTKLGLDELWLRIAPHLKEHVIPAA